MSACARRLAPVLLAAGLALAPTSAHAAFGLKEYDVSYSNADGSPATQAGSHPFAMTTTFGLNEVFDPNLGSRADGEVKDVIFDWSAGLTANASAMPTCSTADFLDLDPETATAKCPSSSAVGLFRPVVFGPGVAASREPWPVFNLPPPPGVAAKFGFLIFGVPGIVEMKVHHSLPDELTAVQSSIPQIIPFFGSALTFWGIPADRRHDSLRGACAVRGGDCETNSPEVPLLTLPRSCSGPLIAGYEADSWWEPGTLSSEGWPELTDPRWVTGETETHDGASPPNPIGTTGCGKLAFHSSATAQPTTVAASSPTGLDFSLEAGDEGLSNPADGAVAAADVKEAKITLPKGMTINPSLAEGLEVCTGAQLERETAFSIPGQGCPNAAKIGTAEAELPTFGKKVAGSLFIAQPYENPFGSLIAMYLVFQDPARGILIKQPLKVETDPTTGQITTTAQEMPQIPFSDFKLHFREGTRSPLVSPPACGAYDVEAELTPWSGTAPITTTSAFQIISGPESNPCPTGGLSPFKPGLIAGTLNNAAGRFSPFSLRLFRNDSEQEITHFSIKLPPGILGKLAGIPYCSDAAIAQAKSRTGPNGGQRELQRSSCPAASQVGRTLVGLGVGATPAYAPGKLYLAGPYHGSAISLVAITAGKVGPFDLGTVVVREAFEVDPETAQVFLDATGSDPIPHIIRGIPTHLRDVRVYVDRSNFVLNPTDCRRTSTASTLLGSGLDFGSEADDRPVTVSTPFQAADCAALSFKPRLSLALRGATRRGAHPAFKATLAMSGIGEAGIQSAQVTLPKSEFIANAHFKTICTKAQFNQGGVPGERCPANSIYGQARAVTPLLDEPLQGPLILRSSEHKLPDVVASLHSNAIDIVLAGRLDSVEGRLRASFEAVPDAPITSATFSLQGASKGLFENSTNLCKGTHKAIVSFAAQNGKRRDFTAPLEASGCSKTKQRKPKQRG